jgi:hypothetical protein
MRKYHYIRMPIFALLVLVTLFLLHKAAMTPPDPGYGRVPAFLIYGFFTFLIWIPYNTTCMFLDGNKGLGIAAIIIIVVTLTVVVFGTRDREFGFQTMALLLCTLSLIALWILSVINFFLRRKNAKTRRCS